VFMKTLEQGSTNYYYAINDHLGAVQKLVANNGSMVWSMAQDAFGLAMVSSSSTITNNLRFSSQYYDPESGLHYNTHRYYDPLIGRYLSMDPIGENGFVVLYKLTPRKIRMQKKFSILPNMLFVANNPIGHIDILGLKMQNKGCSSREWNYAMRILNDELKALNSCPCLKSKEAKETAKDINYRIRYENTEVTCVHEDDDEFEERCGDAGVIARGDQPGDKIWLCPLYFENTYKGTLLHEIAHNLGLGHGDAMNEIQYPCRK